MVVYSCCQVSLSRSHHHWRFHKLPNTDTTNDNPLQASRNHNISNMCLDMIYPIRSILYESRSSLEFQRGVVTPLPWPGYLQSKIVRNYCPFVLWRLRSIHQNYMRILEFSLLWESRRKEKDCGYGLSKAVKMFCPRGRFLQVPGPRKGHSQALDILTGWNWRSNVSENSFGVVVKLSAIAELMFLEMRGLLHHVR